MAMATSYQTPQSHLQNIGMKIQYGNNNKGMGVGSGRSEVTANDIKTTNTSSESMMKGDQVKTNVYY